MDEIRRERIIKAGIVDREDWERLAPEHIALADAILIMLDFQKANPGLEIFSDESFRPQEEQAEELLEKIRDFNDEVELEDFDKVQPNKTFDAGIPIGIPTSLVPIFNIILGES
jgi:hypothetical protein